MRDATFYVPRLTGYPRWFAVVGKAPHGDNALVMVRPSEAAPWRESMVINDQAPAAPLAASFPRALARDPPQGRRVTAARPPPYSGTE
jgi:hypothetical protein